MDCTQIAEVLPWFLNGTLESSATDEIRAHLDTCERCRQQLDETRVAARIYSQHLPSAALVEYAFDRAPGDIGRDLIERHLASCTACRDELDLVRTSRRALEEPASPVVAFQPRHPAAGIRIPTWLAAAAGVVLVAGVSAWLTATLLRSGDRPIAADRRIARLNTELEQARKENERLQTRTSALQQEQGRAREEASRLQARVAELEQPAANVVAVDVLPSELVERTPGARVNEISLPRETTSLTLILQAPSEARFARHAIELATSAGKVVWRARGLVRNPTGDYTVHVPASFLAPGTYRITVFGERNGSRTRTESYTIRVRQRS